MGVQIVSAAESRNLVIVRAGDGSRHEQMIPGALRGWYDLVVSYFGNDAGRFRQPIENRVDVRGGKWDGIAKTLDHLDDRIGNYEYVWLPDDDIDIDCESIRSLFDLMRKHRLAVGQPALSHDSWFTFLQLLRCKSFDVRWTDGVEPMAPCFETEVLRRVRPLFAETMSGYGLDSIWSRVEADNHRRTAVIDAIEMRHSRPVGGGQLYGAMAIGGRDPFVEMGVLLQRHGVEATKFLISAGKTRNGKTVGWIRATMLMTADLIAAYPHSPMKRHYFNKLWRYLRQARHQSNNLTPVKIICRAT